MAMSKGKKSKSYTSGYGGSEKMSHGTAPMKGGQMQGKGGRGNTQRGMTMTRKGGAKGGDVKC